MPITATAFPLRLRLHCKAARVGGVSNTKELPMSEPTAQSVIEKFEFYLLGLTFTLLGLSIQTAGFQASPVLSVWGELIGWALLGLSGFVGLSKVQWTASILHVKASKESFESLKNDLKLAQAGGAPHVMDGNTSEPVSFDEVFDKTDRKIAQFERALNRLGDRHELKHHIQWWSFILGLTAIGAMRGYAAVC
jgi:hypothetical protein